MKNELSRIVIGVGVNSGELNVLTYSNFVGQISKGRDPEWDEFVTSVHWESHMYIYIYIYRCWKTRQSIFVCFVKCEIDLKVM